MGHWEEASSCCHVDVAVLRSCLLAGVFFWGKTCHHGGCCCGRLVLLGWSIIYSACNASVFCVGVLLCCAG